jgi:phosphopantothenoylcysteine synthetase/decarboxylase
VLPADTPDRSLSSAAEVGRLLADTINQALRGEVDARVANNVGFLASVLLRTIDRTDTEHRLARLEKILTKQGSTVDSDPIEFVSAQEDEDGGDIDQEDDGEDADDDGEDEDLDAEQNDEGPEEEDGAEELDAKRGET